MPRHASVARRLRRAAVALVAAALAWLLLVNLSLWTGLVAWVVSGERERSTLRLEHGWAWTLWPTVVHVRDLRLALDGPRWQLELRLPRAEADVELLELLRRRFVASDLRGEGASLTYVAKRPPNAEPAALAGLPRIAGLPPPRRDIAPRPLPDPDEAWTVTLRGVDAGLDRLRVDAFEAELAGGRLIGALEATSARRFALPGARLDVAEATLRRGDQTLAQGLRGHVVVEIAPYDPQELRGRAALRRLSGEVEVQARLAGLRWLADAGLALPVALAGGEGTLDAALELRDGALRPGSRARYQAEALAVTRRLDDGAVTVTGAPRVEATVGDAGGPQLRATVRGLAARSGDGAEDPWLSADALELAVALASADLVDGPGPVTGASAELPSLRVDDLGAAPGMAALGLHAGHLAGRASARRGDEAGRYALDFAVDVDGLALARGDLSLRSDGYVRGEGTLRRGAGELHLEPVHAELRGLALATGRGDTRGDWIEVDRAAVHHDREARRLRVDARGRLSDLRLLLAHLRPGDDLFERVPGLRGLRDPVAVDLTVTRTPGSLVVDVDTLDGGPVDAMATIARAGDHLRAVVLFRRARVGVTRAAGGDRDLELAASPEWFADRSAWVRAVGAAARAP